VKSWKWLNARLVETIHDEVIYEFGGLGGVQSRALLESALDRPRNKLAYEPESTLFELAASICVGVVKNHPFIDGNKRTALLATRLFLLLNGYEFEPAEDDEVVTMIAVAEDVVGEPDLASWLRAHARAP
jgi:death on curing protein